MKSRACNLVIFFNLPCKMNDFLMLDLECLMILFRIEIQTMSFEIGDLCKFYFDITDPNDNKAFELSNRVIKLIFLNEKEREKECQKLGNVGLWSLLWWNNEGLCHLEDLEYEEYANQLNLFYK